MSRGEEKTKRWRLSLADAFVLMTGMCITISLVPILLALRNPTDYEFKALRTGAGAFVGSLGYLFARLDGVNKRTAITIGTLAGVAVGLALVARSYLISK